MTRDEVKKVFMVLRNVYPQFEVTSEKLDIWHKLFQDQNSAIVMKNLEQYVTVNKFPPTIADLREQKIKVQPDARDKDIEFQNWVSNGGKAEHFDWVTGKGFNLEEE
jgi:hypothetical protein